MKRHVLTIGIGLGAFFTAASAMPQPQDLAAVSRAVDAFVRAQTNGLPGRLEISAPAIDPRLTLTRCDSLEAFLPTGARLWGNSTVGVRCQAPDKWSLFVPVQVRVWTDVVVATRSVPRGQVLKVDDVMLQSLDLTQLPRGVLTDVHSVQGKAAVGRIAGGMPVRSDMLRGVAVVFQGQSVRVIFVGDGLRVSSEGRALGNAGQGEPVQVRSASGKLIRGIVQGPGIVEVR
jgi:flagella basal body P-ring formation protein FlgA